MLTVNKYNPDVLTCIANLSSDEVFTPPQLANQILDLLPAELWSDKKATFLDLAANPVCSCVKSPSGLDKGLRSKSPTARSG